MCHCNRRLLYQAPYLVCDVDDDGWRGDALAQEVDLFRWVQLVFFACKKKTMLIRGLPFMMSEVDGGVLKKQPK